MMLVRAQERVREDGASAVEYGLLLSLIAAVLVAAVFALGSMVEDGLGQTCKQVDDVATNISASDPAGCQ